MSCGRRSRRGHDHQLTCVLDPGDQPSPILGMYIMLPTPTAGTPPRTQPWETKGLLRSSGQNVGLSPTKTPPPRNCKIHAVTANTSYLSSSAYHTAACPSFFSLSLPSLYGGQFANQEFISLFGGIMCRETCCILQSKPGFGHLLIWLGGQPSHHGLWPGP